MDAQRLWKPREEDLTADNNLGISHQGIRGHGKCKTTLENRTHERYGEDQEPMSKIRKQ